TAICMNFCSWLRQPSWVGRKREILISSKDVKSPLSTAEANQADDRPPAPFRRWCKRKPGKGGRGHGYSGTHGSVQHMVGFSTRGNCGAHLRGLAAHGPGGDPGGAGGVPGLLPAF